MSKKPPRKPVRKRTTLAAHTSHPFIDDDLAELAAVLAEHEMENQSAGWFVVPWRSGWNAVGLASAVASFDPGGINCGFDDIHVHQWLTTVWTHRDTATMSAMYEKAEEHLARYSHTLNRLLRASLRCLQVMASNSDGGGHVYNTILAGPFQDRLVHTEVASTVLEHRCRDSIGVTAALSGDGHDRVRRAFRIAWERGLYRAAYALPPVVLRVD